MWGKGNDRCYGPRLEARRANMHDLTFDVAAPGTRSSQTPPPPLIGTAVITPGLDGPQPMPD